jgi:hypothetical protein
VPDETPRLLAAACAQGASGQPAAAEEAAVEGILVRLQHALGKKPTRTRKEQEFIVTMYETWEDARTETLAKAVLTVLRVRGIAVPAAVRKRILAEKNLKQLERWHEKAIVAASIEEVIGKRS